MDMKTIALLLIASLALTTGCKERKDRNSTIITTDYEAPKPTGPIAMGPTETVREVEWADGRHYRVTVSTAPSDTLPMVKNDMGQQYKDNVIRLEVTRADSSVFLTRTFTKHSFSQWVPADYREQAILQGLNLLKADDEAGLQFVAWLNRPDALDDEAIELKVNISRMGDIDIQRFTNDDREDLRLEDAQEY